MPHKLCRRHLFLSFIFQKLFDIWTQLVDFSVLYLAANEFGTTFLHFLQSATCTVVL